MIQKQDILDRAAEWQLRPEVVEKDYVLGWLLAGLAQMPFRDLWVFKGGTCIKKCYFETYRFSEDLDFSLQPDAPYSGEALVKQLGELAELVADLSGLALPTDMITVKPRHNKQGQETFEGRMAYRGPLEYPGSPKIRFDFTQHETVIDSPVARAVLHPYPDDFSADVAVTAYSFNELLAEKTRALLERSRPRDLYDVVHLLENAPGQFDLSAVRSLFRQKCTSKAVEIPTPAQLVVAVKGDDELRSEWANMLGHQLPTLPSLDALLERLPGLLAWIDAPMQPLPGVQLPQVARRVAETSVVAPGIRYWGSSLPLEAVRFAGTNRLLVEFWYHGKHRTVEPYSIRQAQTGNILLYAWEIEAGHIKAYKLDEMQNVHTTGTSFSPRYQVEISSTGSLSIPVMAPRAPRRTSSPSRPAGRTYVFECPACGKRFPRKTNDSTLRPHKTPQGWDCPGRRGHRVDMLY